jgi:polyribonucleotide nucleotidyltransferase
MFQKMENIKTTSTQVDSKKATPAFPAATTQVAPQTTLNQSAASNKPTDTTMSAKEKAEAKFAQMQQASAKPATAASPAAPKTEATPTPPKSIEQILTEREEEIKAHQRLLGARRVLRSTKTDLLQIQENIEAADNADDFEAGFVSIKLESVQGTGFNNPVVKITHQGMVYDFVSSLIVNIDNKIARIEDALMG